MGSVVVRWESGDYRCEVETGQGLSTLSIRQDGAVLATERVSSVQHAYDRAAMIIQARRAGGAQRTGT